MAVAARRRKVINACEAAAYDDGRRRAASAVIIYIGNRHVYGTGINIIVLYGVNDNLCPSALFMSSNLRLFYSNQFKQ